MLLLAFTAAACAEKTPPPVASLSGKDNTIQTIAAVPIRFTGGVTVRKPVAGAAAGMAEGARQGGLGSFLAGASAANSTNTMGAAALGIVLAPVTTVIGAIVGASSAHSTEEVNVAATALGDAFVNLHPEVAVCDQLVMTEGNHGTYKIHAFAAQDARQDYLPLVSTGTDLVLEITVESFNLLSRGNIAPDVALYLGMRVNVVRATDGSETRSSSWVYIGKWRDYFAAAANSARLLRSDIDSATGSIAKAIASELLTESGALPASGVPIIQNRPRVASIAY